MGASGRGCSAPLLDKGGEALQQHRDNGGVQIRANGSRLQVHLVLHTHGRLFGALGLRGSRARIQMHKVRSSVQKKKDARRCGHHSGAEQGRKGGGPGVFGAALVRTSSESSAPAPASGGSSVGGAGASSRGVSSIFPAQAATLGERQGGSRGGVKREGRPPPHPGAPTAPPVLLRLLACSLCSSQSAP